MASEDKTKKFVSDDEVSTAATPESPEGGKAVLDPKKNSKKDIPNKELDEALDEVLESLEASDDFKRQLKGIFESVVEKKVEILIAEKADEFTAEVLAEGAVIRAQLDEKVASLQEEADAREAELKESAEAEKEKLLEGVSNFLDYVAGKFLEENTIAIESSLAVERANRIVEGLTSVLAEAKVEVSEQDISLFADLEEKVEAATNNYNEVLRENMALKALAEATNRAAIVRDASTDLTESQAEQLSMLVEKLSMTDSESFTSDVLSIKERMFKASPKKLDMNENNELITEAVKEPAATGHDDYVKAIADAISRLK